MSQKVIGAASFICPLCAGHVGDAPVPQGGVHLAGSYVCLDMSCPVGFFYVALGSESERERLKAIVRVHQIASWHEGELRKSYDKKVREQAEQN